MVEKAKLSSTAINIHITLLKVVINYAMKMRYVSYDGLRAVDREGYKTKR